MFYRRDLITMAVVILGLSYVCCGCPGGATEY